MASMVGLGLQETPGPGCAPPLEQGVSERAGAGAASRNQLG